MVNSRGIKLKLLVSEWVKMKDE